MSGRFEDAESSADDVPFNRSSRDIIQHEAAENTPLLPTDLPPEVAPDKSLRLLVTIIACLSLVMVGVAQRLCSPALQEIMEDVICRNVHADHQLNSLSPPDSRCKENDVQKILTMVTAMDVSAEMIVRKCATLAFCILSVESTDFVYSDLCTDTIWNYCG